MSKPHYLFQVLSKPAMGLRQNNPSRESRTTQPRKSTKLGNRKGYMQ